MRKRNLQDKNLQSNHLLATLARGNVQAHPYFEGSFQIGLHLVEISVDGTQEVIRGVPKLGAREPCRCEMLLPNKQSLV